MFVLQKVHGTFKVVERREKEWDRKGGGKDYVSARLAIELRVNQLRALHFRIVTGPWCVFVLKTFIMRKIAF